MALCICLKLREQVLLHKFSGKTGLINDPICIAAGLRTWLTRLNHGHVGSIASMRVWMWGYLPPALNRILVRV